MDLFDGRKEELLLKNFNPFPAAQGGHVQEMGLRLFRAQSSHVGHDCRHGVRVRAQVGGDGKQDAGGEAAPG